MNLSSNLRFILGDIDDGILMKFRLAGLWSGTLPEFLIFN